MDYQIELEQEKLIEAALYKRQQKEPETVLSDITKDFLQEFIAFELSQAILKILNSKEKLSSREINYSFKANSFERYEQVKTATDIRKEAEKAAAKAAKEAAKNGN